MLLLLLQLLLGCSGVLAWVHRLSIHLVNLVESRLLLLVYWSLLGPAGGRVSRLLGRWATLGRIAAAGVKAHAGTHP